MVKTKDDKTLVEIYKETIKRIIEASKSDGPQRKVIKEKISAQGQDQQNLAQEARDTREKTVGNGLIVRASLEFSNKCRQQCGFCAMKASNRELERYALTPDQMTTIISDVYGLGVRNLHLASGEDWSYKATDLAGPISIAVNQGMDVTLVTSHRPLPDYQTFRDAQAHRYILKVETTNETLFADARMGTELETRLSHLLHLRDLGFKIGTGIICGLPDQTVDDLAGDILFLKELCPDMASVSRFQPNPDSRYANHREGNPDTTVNFLSLMRTEISTPGLRIPASTTLGPRQESALAHGANVVSLHVTPENVADRYSADRIGARELTRSLEKVRYLAAKTNMTLDL